MLHNHPARTHTCGELSELHLEQQVVLKGWVDTRRDLGGVIFVDLRDRYGLTQIVFSPQNNAAAHNLAEELRSEYVISITGSVALRSPETVNSGLDTGMIEVRVENLLVLSRSEPLPFSVSVHAQKTNLAAENLRLKYRYLDLRRPALQHKIILRHQAYQIIHRYFDAQGFLEVETPMLMKSTPEGARDYLVPSRVQPGRFYALPQSPQTYKQLLMVGGIDKYVQIVKCFRDEDLRADRQPEFTQIDVEMAFATEDAVYTLTEGLMAALWEKVLDIKLPRPFPRLTYQDALAKYGSDKPDIRFDLPICDLSTVFRNSTFRVFEQALSTGGSVLGLVIPGFGNKGRGYMDRLDKTVVRKQIGAGGLIHVRIPSDGSSPNCSVKTHVLPEKFVTRAISDASAKAGDLLLIMCGNRPAVQEYMGLLRLHMAQELNCIDESSWKFVWITDFPLLQWDDGEKRYSAMHHPFTSPQTEDIGILSSQPAQVRARAYDIVLNGIEIGGGSIRIHDQDVQIQMFEALGISEKERESRFGFFLEALRYGTPPHGGIALGLDRIIMLLSGATSLRDVIAFPKTQSAQEPMSGTPSTVDKEQLDELYIRSIPKPE